MIFVHDHTFLKKDGRFYTSGSLNNRLFERYKFWFGNVEVLANEKLTMIKDNKNICEENVVSSVKFTLFKKSNNLIEVLTNRKKIKNTVFKQDCVVARMPSIYGIMAIRDARKFNKPYLIEVVGCPWDSLWNHGLKGKIIAPFMWFGTKKTVYNASYVVYVTNEFLQHRYPSQGKILGCSDVALPTLDNSVLERRLNKIKKMSKNKPIIIGTTAAINVRYKGQEYVIKAISKLNKNGLDFEYHLAGGGDMSYLKSIAEKYNVDDKVKFLGSLPHEKVFDYLDNIDIYIQPSKQEGLPRALIEAISRGCPALGSTTGGIPELLNKKFIFHNNSVNEICELLKKIDKNVMIEEAKRGFEKAKEYDKKILDKKRTDFYQEFIAVEKINLSNSMNENY